MTKARVRFIAFSFLAVLFSLIAWRGEPGQRVVWGGIGTVFLMLAIMTKRRESTSGKTAA